MRLRISRKLIRHLRAQCFARDSLKFEKRSQFFVGGDDESLSVVAVCISNEDRLSAGINRWDAAQLQPALLRLSAMVSQYFTRRLM
jgi:hypothetical protein